MRTVPNFTHLDLVPLFYALVLGGLIGLEREIHGRPAGLRTHSLVCICSTMLIMISREGADLGDTTRMVYDPNRMGAGIVTGIGFLGAATVLRAGEFLRGLTTAACIWFVAGLGIVLGHGDYALGVVSTLFVLSVLTYFDVVTRLVKPSIYRRIHVAAQRDEIQTLIDEVKGLLGAEQLRLLDVDGGQDNTNGMRELTFHVGLKNDLQGPRVIERVAALPGVLTVKWSPIGK